MFSNELRLLTEKQSRKQSVCNLKLNIGKLLDLITSIKYLSMKHMSTSIKKKNKSGIFLTTISIFLILKCTVSVKKLNRRTFLEKNSIGLGIVKCFEIIFYKKKYPIIFVLSSSEQKCSTHMRIRQWS